MTLRLVFRLFLFPLFASALFSCTTCGNADIPISKFDFEFAVVDAETGENLMSGGSPQLDPQGFALYSMRGTERIPHELYVYPPESFSGDQVIRADIRGVHGDFYLAYPNGKVDTLQAFFSVHETECWGRVDTLLELVRNGSESFTDMYAVLRFRY